MRPPFLDMSFVVVVVNQLGTQRQRLADLAARERDDFSGKGVAAGLLMPSIEVALRMDAARSPSTSDLLQTFNNVVCRITSGRRFISMFYGKLYPQSGSLEYTNAGHNP